MTREDINSRALDAIAYLLSSNELNTKTSIANSLEISASKFSEILGGRMKAGTDVLAGLSSEFNISPQWLLTGEGDMIDSENQNLNSEKLPATEEFEYIDNDNNGRVPIVSELNFAISDPEDPSKIKADDYYYVKEFRNADFMLRISGDYMAPKYRSGDLIACRHDRYNTFYQWGRIYALLTCSLGLIVGRVYEHRQNTIFITVKPENPAYPEWEIPIDEVAKAALVVGSISLD